MATSYWVIESSTDTEISGGFSTESEALEAANAHVLRTGHAAHVEAETS